MNRIARNTLKATIVTGAFVGEIAWQKAGAPGRESFEPLQHVGNLGIMISVSTITSWIANSLIVTRAQNGFNILRRSPRVREYTIDEKARIAEDIKVEDSRLIRQSYKVLSLMQIPPNVFVETVGEGTHDIKDAIYGIAAGLLALRATYLIDQPVSAINAEYLEYTNSLTSTQSLPQI